ncbi:MAG: hypothetical protein FE78DRAFT_151411 [Acidomyces sp. 'richmondensis']|nr:MAG: hypothetical protein FE78DRAFT_151411 [Acidomyces sp. 'richmondensis']
MPPVSRLDEGPSTATRPIRRHQFPNPKLRLHINDLAHEGSTIFLSHVKGNEDLEAQVQNVLNLLYHTAEPTATAPRRPGTRSVTFILHDFSGLAYTTGTELDGDHKEIHLSCSFLAKLADDGARHEILGVICHELVHCFQFAAEGTAPGGLIEGVADWVRLKAGLAARHWKREAEGRWDAGYQKTGYFLEYLEQRFGEGTVRRMNAVLGEGRYDEKALFARCCGGKEVEELWRDYCEGIRRKDVVKMGEVATETEDGTLGPIDTPSKCLGDG